jgi:hypothetical protein
MHRAAHRPVDRKAGRADGYIAVRQSISSFDNGNPAIARLDANLRTAIQRAATDARSAGIAIALQIECSRHRASASERVWVRRRPSASMASSA